MLFLDGVYIDSPHGPRVRFRWIKAPNSDELTRLTHTIAHRVARYLERQGLLERDAGHTYLTAEDVDEDPESPMNQLLGSSITYRIAVGPQQGRKVFTLQTLPDESDRLSSSSVGETAGFSLHAGVATKANERAKLERLCRYIARPAVSTKRLSLTRFHGVFAPNSKHRAQVTPAKRGKVKKIRPPDQDQTTAERRAAMTWAQRLKRVFNIDIEICDKCGGDVRIIASIEDPAVIRKILTHLNTKAIHTDLLPQCRAPPGTGFLSEAQRFAGPDRSIARL